MPLSSATADRTNKITALSYNFLTAASKWLWGYKMEAGLTSDFTWFLEGMARDRKRAKPDSLGSHLRHPSSATNNTEMAVLAASFKCLLLHFCQDDLEAYKTQNQFLNSEIHQVTKIWSTVAEREKTLLMKVRNKVA